MARLVLRFAQTLGVLLAWVGTTTVHGQCAYDVTAISAGPRCHTFGNAINERGEVVGSYRCGLGESQIFFWSADAGFVPIAAPPDVCSAWASDINDHGQIVGTINAVCDPFTGFLYEDGEYTLLPPAPGGVYSWANAINNLGQVVGTRSIGDGVNPQNAFVWSREDGFIDLGLMDAFGTSGIGVNTSGQVVGFRGLLASTEEGFVWDDGQIAFLGDFPGGGTTGVGGINKFGDVAGYSRIRVAIGGESIWQAFIWQGELTVLPSLNTHLNCGAVAINDLGQAVGSCFAGVYWNRRSALWQGGAIYDLDDLTPPLDGQLERGRDANNSGHIVCTGDGADGWTITYLLIPRDPPTGDITKDCVVGAADLILLLREWGQEDSPADINGDGVVDIGDLDVLLTGWT